MCKTQYQVPQPGTLLIIHEITDSTPCVYDNLTRIWCVLCSTIVGVGVIPVQGGNTAATQRYKYAHFP